MESSPPPPPTGGSLTLLLLGFYHLCECFDHRQFVLAHEEPVVLVEVQTERRRLMLEELVLAVWVVLLELVGFHDVKKIGFFKDRTYIAHAFLEQLDDTPHLAFFLMYDLFISSFIQVNSFI